MQYEQVRDMLLRQWTYTGGPNEAMASELYHDDVVLEFPQSDEWFRGEKVHRETIYFTEPFPAPEWRRPWAETQARPRRHDDLPEHVFGGR